MIRTAFATIRPTKSAIVQAGFLFLSIVSCAGAAEIKLLSAGALQPVMDAALPQFQKSSEHIVVPSFGPVGSLTDRIRRGEYADVAIISDQQNERLQSEGKIIAGSRLDVARVGVGIGVRKGAPKPDVSSVESFKSALLNAKSIAYGDPADGGPSDIYIVQLLDRLNLGPEVKSKTKVFPTTALAMQAVGRGEIEIGFRQASVIIAAPDLDFAGPLPAEIQNYTVFAAGVITTSKQVEAARQLIQFLSSPAIKASMKPKGFE